MSTVGSTATAMPLRASLLAPTGCLSLQRTAKRVPPDEFEPQADLALRPSALHLAEKLFKKLLKFRKKAGFAGSILCGPVKEPQTMDMEKRYDSDELSGEVVSVCSDTPKSSSGSSRISSSSFESLIGAAASAGIPLATRQKTTVGAALDSPAVL